MLSPKSTILMMLLICAALLLNPVFVKPLAASQSISQAPSARELLDKYSQALDSTENFNSHYELRGEYSGRIPANHPFYSMYGGNRFCYKSFERGMFRFKENKGYYHQEYKWGYFNEKYKNVPEKNPIYRLWITTKKFSYFHQVIKDLYPSGSARRNKNTRETIKAPNSTVGISHILGYIDTEERLDEVLREADRISVRDKTEIIRGSACYVIDAHTKYGEFSIWLDPEHGFHPAKVRRRAKKGEYTHHHIIPMGWIATGYLDVLQFKQIDDIWVPVEVNAGYHRTIGSPKYYMDEDNHYKHTQIILNPDHDKLGSFADPNDPELVNGTRVRLHRRPTRYFWQDGKVVDSSGNAIDLTSMNTISLVGKALPELTGFNLKLNPRWIENKMVLICFFDMNQRPSRNCLMQLAQKAAELKEKGVAVVAVQASKVSEKTLNGWIKKNNILFPVGMITADIKKTRFARGVRSLPWLILTDKEHIVRAEGFALEEMGERIKVAGGEKR